MSKMDRYRVKPGDRVDLRARDAGCRRTFDGDKAAGRARLIELNHELETLQELLYAEHQHKVLIVLQATDTGGKDGTIRHVFEGVNPQGVRVASFKKPTPRRARPRLPLARASACAGARRDRHLQPQPLRGRARGARA